MRYKYEMILGTCPCIDLATTKIISNKSIMFIIRSFVSIYGSISYFHKLLCVYTISMSAFILRIFYQWFGKSYCKHIEKDSFSNIKF